MSTNVLVDSPYETQDPKSISKSAGQAKESQSTPTELIDIITCMKIFTWQGTNRQMDTRETKPLFTNKWSLMGSGPFGEVVQCYKRSLLYNNCITSNASPHFLKLPIWNGENHVVSNRNFWFSHVISYILHLVSLILYTCVFSSTITNSLS